jgi:CubicO group peptidase (beta-lactamase class C family)
MSKTAIYGMRIDGRLRPCYSALWIVFVSCALCMSAGGAGSSASKHDVYPESQWQRAHVPEQLGWSAAKLVEARQYADTIETAAVVIVDNGIIVAEWGQTDRKFIVHSIRKSFLSALYGIAVAKGAINLRSTLAELQIDDDPPLSAQEKQARVIDLLKARSGIYHATLFESPAMIANKPPRGSHPPNTFWYYNNWDFNALGTIYDKATKTSLFQAFATEIAAPLQMEDLALRDTEYVHAPATIHPAYPFRMTARDMARFGLLYLRKGAWRGKQVVPKAWVEESTKAYSVADGDRESGYSGYGYMWWVEINGNHINGVSLPAGSYSAEGMRGHYITVIPAFDLVVVHRVDTDKPEGAVTNKQYGKLLSLILDARLKGNHEQ